jgi:hypothetical protein
MFAEQKLKVRMRRKAWRPLILGVRNFLYVCERTVKREEREKW